MLTAVTSVVSTLGAPLVPEIARTPDVPLRPAQWSLTLALLARVAGTAREGGDGG